LARKWSNGSLSNPVAETELPEWTLGESSDEVRSPTPDEIRRIHAASIINGQRRRSLNYQSPAALYAAAAVQ